MDLNTSHFMNTKTISTTSLNLARSRFLPLTSKRMDGVKQVYSTAGIPAAGKFTFIAQLITNSILPSNAFLLNPDSIMEFLPEYQEDVARFGAESAFARWEEPSVDLAYELLDTARLMGLDIIIDMGLARPESLDLIQQLKYKDGYRITIYWLDTPIDVALERIRHRKRHTPIEMVRSRALILSGLRAKYYALADEFHTIPYHRQD